MSDIYFQKQGQGVPVILLHGFPFNRTIWNNFSASLSNYFQVITPDLPGFGKSEGVKRPFTIDEIGDIIANWISKESILQPVFVGHSLGGYVALRVAEKLGDHLNSLVLFHSTAYADSEEKKQSRNKVLEFIDKNGVKAFTSNFISSLFVNQQHPAIETVRSIAVEAAEETVKGYTEAMRDRKAKLDVLKTFTRPVLFLAGDRDPGISVESIHQQASVCSMATTQILEGVAHMGMFEHEKKSLEFLQSFILKNTVT